ncbi:MAG: hypothetical protein KC468_21365 [Myxococcales bacterium]|nr:hypothetical protein [Myxococcales bacterium]
MIARASGASRRASGALCSALLLACVACGDSAPVGASDTDGPLDTGVGELSEHGQRLPNPPMLDVVLVIDNSASMAVAQARLQASVGALASVLRAPELGVDYRIAMTTSDMGHPSCSGPAYTRPPDRGSFALESCRARMGVDGDRDDFLFDGPQTVDARSVCSDWCEPSVHAALAEGVTPTAVEGDDAPRPRPWLQGQGARSNLPDAVFEAVAALPVNTDELEDNDVDALTAALRCLLPPGVTGCGFEAPLESLHFAGSRSYAPGESNAGFFRDGAHRAIVFITDEVDCSWNPEQVALFGQEDSWSWEPGAAVATSAVCWNAGVTCDGVAPGPYACNPTQRALDGALLNDEDPDAVLYPLSRYVDDLTPEDEYGLVRNPVVSLITGVPRGYHLDGAAALEYRDDPDPVQQIEYGIGPGCTGSSGDTARPPVRLRELGLPTTPEDRRALFSICDDDYSPALARLVDGAREVALPICFEGCALDLDPATAVIDASCTVVVEDDAAGPPVELPLCERDPKTGAPVAPSGAGGCFGFFNDSGGATPELFDDLAPECASVGWNLQLFLVGVPGDAGAVRARCLLSDELARDCPNLALE